MAGEQRKSGIIMRVSKDNAGYVGRGRTLQSPLKGFSAIIWRMAWVGEKVNTSEAEVRGYFNYKKMVVCTKVKATGLESGWIHR